MNANREPPNDSWSQYRRLVLAELERLDNALRILTEEMLNNERHTQTLKEELIDRINLNIESISEKYMDKLGEKERYIISENRDNIEKLQNCIIDLGNKCDKLSADVQVLKGKAALLGFIAGLIVAVVSLFVK